ncbi:MAG: carboxypeptidase-like regulatory domain-containing protein [Flavobacteriaceae bacterium]|nr:carboxypeptidase-like regulatory domain-containing protein [Flavobacteriaceae bacterium]
MENNKHFPNYITRAFIALFLAVLISSNSLIGANLFQDQVQQIDNEYVEFSGTVEDIQTGNPLVFATISVEQTNISTIANTDGEFLIKIPRDMMNGTISIAILGFKTKRIPISELSNENNRIKLEVLVTELSEINVKLPKDAKALVKMTLKKKGENYLNKEVLMTAFYRETIKKRKKNVSLAEAIVNIYKQPNSVSKRDYIKLYKDRKSTDYSKLDTVALKLQGGPFNALYVDLMKYPSYVFTEDVMDLYIFSFAPSTTVNGKPVYVVRFKQRADIYKPLYYGKLFIDAETLALTSAVYNLNVEDKKLASELFVLRKPRNVFVYPTEAAYRVDYRVKDGLWYYGYSNVQLSFKINKKGKLFNSFYSLTSEMAVTDWKINSDGESVKGKDRLKTSVIISDEASGFSDPEFWGAYNVIEPEKSIESAINKIKRQLKKVNL